MKLMRATGWSFQKKKPNDQLIQSHMRILRSKFWALGLPKSSHYPLEGMASWDRGAGLIKIRRLWLYRECTGIMVHSNYSLFPGISQQSGSASAAHTAEATLDLQASRYRLNPWDPNQTLRCICKKELGSQG